MLYKSCHFVEHGLVFTWKDVLTCCLYQSDDRKNVLFNSYFADEDFSLQNILDKKEYIRDKFKQGQIFQGCIGCHNLEEKDWDDEIYINVIYISHWTKCNCNCFYCYYDGGKKFFQKFKNKKILPLLVDMNEKNILKNDGYIVITGGEPTELDELDSIINFFIKNNQNKIVLNSSGIKLNTAIEKALKKDIMELTISIDSADRELYKKIKRIDKFNQVVKNIKKYVNAQGANKKGVRLKYIILPGVNDTIENIKNWINLCLTLRVEHIILDIETNYYLNNKNRLPFHIYDIIKYAEREAEKYKLEISYYSHVSQIKHEMNEGK